PHAADFSLFLADYSVSYDTVGRLAAELPVVIGYVLQIPFEDSQRVLDLCCQEPSVLVSDLFGRAFEVQVDPASAFGAAGFCKNVSGRRRGGLRRPRPGRRAQ